MKYYSRYKWAKHAHPDPLYYRATAEASTALVEPEGKRINFSGHNRGNDDILMKPLKPLPPLDMLLMESTYGKRYEKEQDPSSQLAEIINAMASRGGVLIVFALVDYWIPQHHNSYAPSFLVIIILCPLMQLTVLDGHNYLNQYASYKPQIDDRLLDAVHVEETMEGIEPLFYMHYSNLISFT